MSHIATAGTSRQTKNSKTQLLMGIVAFKGAHIWVHSLQVPTTTSYNKNMF